MKAISNLIYLSIFSVVFSLSHAEQVKIPGHSYSDSIMELPQRGASMDTVRFKFGNPIKELFPVGNPPITQWEYNGFNVFFEYQHVIHAINLETLILPKFN